MYRRKKCLHDTVSIVKLKNTWLMLQFDPGGGGVLHIMAYTGRLRPKGVTFSGFRYIKG